MYKHGETCPICGSGRLEEKIITEEFEYKGKTLLYPNYVVFHCPNCEESIVDPKSIKESTKKIRDFQREIDGFLTSREIVAIRRKLGLTQDQMGEILGGGKKAFARYETGQVFQSKPMDNLLRVLDQFPGAIQVLKDKAKPEKYNKSCKIVSLFSQKEESLHPHFKAAYSDLLFDQYSIG
jgi:HTH-type transcriptional regulator/antitoxin MqsA